jgi:hypothetical protein
MSSAGVRDDIRVVEEGDSSNVNPHVEPNVEINPGESGSDSGSEPAQVKVLVLRRATRGPEAATISR